ncbi:sarcoplasmic calcium-binding protein-like [Lingula anatina]|uniref:Sarcoplasmic calcium-binding protein-like n=1 Tax=Lingula anatina TaxID=7574 RepID=A0A2R2MSA6_LINAN|nr:sarcoplasmic calcium-binding protein-like [Lingula anatina]|eukprot:XP_023933146.1 sarcoplasmic calcium-binding protein-like [Lingula anatina]
MTAHRVADYMNLDDKSTQELLRSRLKIWEGIIQGGDPDDFKVSEKVYFSHLLATLNTEFREAVVGFVNNDFDSMDLDGDGFISPKEHRAFFYGFGIPTEHSAAVFEAFDTDRDGLISREEFVQGAVDFTLSEDENSPYNCFLGPLVK